MSGYISTPKWTISAGALACLGILAAGAAAEDMTSGDVVHRLKSEEASAFLAGIIEGMAYARYQRDGQDPAGMDCIKSWFYETNGTPAKVLSAMENFSEHAPAAVLAAMIQKECGA